MNEIEIGDYVRDKDGCIIKVKEIQEYKKEDDIWYEQSILNGTWRSMVVKHSKNIIDLIEVGDYVNEIKVIKILPKTFGRCKSIELANHYIISKVDFKAVKTIVTKEQFAQMEYKVVE